MRIGVPKEIQPGETRAPLIPPGVEKLVQLGAEVMVESGVGLSAGHTDDDYRKVGALVSDDREQVLGSAEIVLRLGKPPELEVPKLRKGCLHISFLDPFNEMDLVERLAAAGVSAVSMEMLPRTTRAQKMDALSSQANLAGYVAVVLAAEKMPKIFPMMTTPAGTISPVRVFIIGAGVAGLQAIATAKRLGARVEAYDTRPVVEEQVRSLGAKFAKIDLGETGQTKDGYAKALTAEQLELQRQGMARFCAQADVIVSTAQVFGRRAPTIISKEMVEGMRPGSVIVDLAAESGGNVEGTRCGEIVEVGGVSIIGYPSLARHVPVAASQVYSANLVNMLAEYWDKGAKCFRLNLQDDLIQGCLLTHEGKVCNERLLSMTAAKKS